MIVNLQYCSETQALCLSNKHWFGNVCGKVFFSIGFPQIGTIVVEQGVLQIAGCSVLPLAINTITKNYILFTIE